MRRIIVGVLVVLVAGVGAALSGGVPPIVRRATPTSDDPGLVVRNLPSGTQTVFVDGGTVRVTQATVPWDVNLTHVGDAGVVVPGISGVVAVAGGQAQNEVISQYPVLIGAEVQTGQPVAATSGRQRALVADIDGVLFVRPTGPVHWTCGFQELSDTMLQCQPAPGAGLKLHLTDITVQTANPGATGSYGVRAGQGADCDAGTTPLFPWASTAARWHAPARNEAPFVQDFITPVTAPSDYAICVIGSPTNTINIQLQGYTAP
jgi:hypothetical protein